MKRVMAAATIAALIVLTPFMASPHSVGATSSKYESPWLFYTCDFSGRGPCTEERLGGGVFFDNTTVWYWQGPNNQAALCDNGSETQKCTSINYVNSSYYCKTTTNGHCTVFEFWYNYNTNWQSSTGSGTCSDGMRLDFDQYGNWSDFQVTSCY